jgi:hypothetical protein
MAPHELQLFIAAFTSLQVPFFHLASPHRHCHPKQRREPPCRHSTHTQRERERERARDEASRSSSCCSAGARVRRRRRHPWPRRGGGLGRRGRLREGAGDTVRARRQPVLRQRVQRLLAHVAGRRPVAEGQGQRRARRGRRARPHRRQDVGVQRRRRRQRAAVVPRQLQREHLQGRSLSHIVPLKWVVPLLV